MRKFIPSERVELNAPQLLWKHRGGVLLFLFAVAGALSYPFHLSQDFYAVYVIAAFFILAMADLDVSFLVFLFLTQFFIGDFYRPYLWILNILVFVLGLVWIFSSIRQKVIIHFPLWWLVMPSVLVLFLAFPLTLKEILLDFRVYGFSRFLELIAISRTIYREFWFKELYWCASSLLTYLMVSNWLKDKKDLLIKSGYVLAAALSVASVYGILHLYKLLPIEGRFLSINFSDQLGYTGMVTSFGWSVTFIAEYFAIVFPMVLFMVFVQKRIILKIFLSVFIGVSALAAFLTYRRAVFVVTGVEIVFFLFLFYFQKERKKGNFFGKKWKELAFVFILAILMVVSGGVFLKKKVVERQITRISLRSFERDSRYMILNVCGKMLACEPVLGLGSGGYTQRFFDFGGNEYLRRWNKKFLGGRVLNKVQGSPHSTYLKMLSERGLLGFLSFLLLAGGFFYFGFKRLWTLNGDEKYLLMAVMTGLGGLLVYGLVMDFFWLPATHVLFWVTLAFIVVLAEPVIPEFPFTKKKALGIGMIFLALLGYRLWRAKAEPISDHYEAGFYRWEIPRKGKDKRPYRLTSGHALKVFTVKGDSIRFRVCSNKPDIARNPQTLDIYLNGKQVKGVTLKNHAWKTVEIPSKALKGKKVFMDLQVGGTWVPYKYGRGRSKRELGVIIGRIRQG